VEDEMSDCSRRDFLCGLAVAAGTQALTGCGLPAVTTSASLGGDIAGGNVSGLLVGQLVAVNGYPLILGRDSGGVYAMTGVCTHAGCDMTQRGQIGSAGVTCDCHGSEFNAIGNVVLGPARAPLQHFSVSIDASGAITVHSGQAVVESTRTPA
jgi:nitrite reductase/ring-hydroxylating ferredoxin subunit